MNKIDSRFYDLTAVLNYTAEDTEADASKGSKGGKTGLLTLGERILINQERAYLLNRQDEYPTMRPYSIPVELEYKVQQIIRQMKSK